MLELLNILKNIDESIDWENKKELFSSGIIDSMQLLEIVSEVEAKYEIEIDFDEIVPENFNSLEAMLGLIEKLQSNK